MVDKHLILIRHGDAEEFSVKGLGSDLLRELTPFGITKINKLSDFLKSQNIYFDKIISSHSARTAKTAQILANKLGYNINSIIYKESLYNCSLEEYIKVLNELKPDLKKLLIVGHSPIITEFGEYLVGKPIGHLQPGGIIYINLGNIGWSEIHNREGKLIFAKNFLQDTLKLA